MSATVVQIWERNVSHSFSLFSHNKGCSYSSCERNWRWELTFIAKVAAPVGVTEALPGLNAGAMYAARVGDALVTILALPAIQTPAKTHRDSKTCTTFRQIHKNHHEDR